ncbi:sugar phosphate permease [Paraburkholderia sp. BL27I4N3]|uniref:MFS transporter n=1 Tax=Paraburkholderia sp. BL27I4N3 TaxID=1938805 RepID=UPI000E397EAD|nr:MFS transporter [Paraburkholderia sp. BL27I4N3]REE17734.1 sugar phosphate permease [Paraburkholderia sp. BL27I4N3]
MKSTNAVLSAAHPTPPTSAHETSQSTRYRWVILVVAFAAWVISFLDRLAWSNVGLDVSKDLGSPLSQLGIFVTAFYCGYVVSNFFMGFVTDRIGARATLTFALIPLGVATFLFGNVTTVFAGLVLQCAMGLAAGADYAACIKLLASWFDTNRRGLALGILTTGPSVGIAVSNAVYPWFLSTHAWHDLYYLLGGITVFIGIACFLFLRNAPEGSAAPSKSQKPSVRALLKNRDLRLLALAGFGANWATWGFAFWSNALMIKGHHMSVADAGRISMLFGIGAVCAKPLVGWITDRMGGKRRPAIIISLAAFAILFLVFGQLNGKTAFLLIAPFLGAAAFVYAPLMAAMAAELVGPAATGSAVGAMNAFWQLGSVIAPTVAGLVFARTNSFIATLATLAVGPAIGAICMMRAREATDSVKV